MNNVQKIFDGCLAACPNIELWRFYLQTKLKQKLSAVNVNPTITRQEIVNDYEYVLDNIGYDIDSNSIWTEYIAYLTEWKVRKAGR
jgi:cleavage stimulation factor subunit 3